MPEWIFLSILGGTVILEAAGPKFRTRVNRKKRWPINFGLFAIYLVCLEVFRISTMVEGSFLGPGFEHGLFVRLKIPFWLTLFLSVLVVDLSIYWLHRLYHSIPFLWRLHRLHHTDEILDFTTGLRFNPIEIIVFLLFRSALAVVLGIPPEATLINEILVLSFGLLTHSNLLIPPAIHPALAKIFVTPNLHRIHHCDGPPLKMSNYGNFLIIWDRLFGTFANQLDLKLFRPNHKVT